MLTPEQLAQKCAESLKGVRVVAKGPRFIKRDPVAAEQFANQNNADPDAVFMDKNLLAGIDDKYKDYQKALTAFRQVPKKRGVFSSEWGMWEHRNEDIPDVIKDATQLQREVEAAGDTFLDDYDLNKYKAQYHLGDLWDPSLYPSRDEIKSKMVAEFYITPLPSTKFEGLGDALSATLNETMKDIHKDVATRFVRHSLERMQDLLGRMNHTLAEKGGKNLRTGPSELVEHAGVLRTANVIENPRVEKLCGVIEHIYRDIAIEDFKENPDLVEEHAIHTGKLMEAVAKRIEEL